MRGADCRVFCPAVQYCDAFIENRTAHSHVAGQIYSLTKVAIRRGVDFYDQDKVDSDPLAADIEVLTDQLITDTEIRADRLAEQARRARTRREEIVAFCGKGATVVAEMVLCNSTYPDAANFSLSDYERFEAQLPKPSA